MNGLCCFRIYPSGHFKNYSSVQLSSRKSRNSSNSVIRTADSSRRSLVGSASCQLRNKIFANRVNFVIHRILLVAAASILNLKKTSSVTLCSTLNQLRANQCHVKEHPTTFVTSGSKLEFSSTLTASSGFPGETFNLR